MTDIKNQILNRSIFLPVFIYFQFCFIILGGSIISLNSIDFWSLESLEMFSPITIFGAVFWYAPYSLMSIFICPLFIYIFKKIRNVNFVKAISLYGLILIGIYLIALIINLILSLFANDWIEAFVWPLSNADDFSKFMGVYVFGNCAFGLIFVFFWNRWFKK